MRATGAIYTTSKNMIDDDTASVDAHAMRCPVPALQRGLAALQAFSIRRPRLTVGELAEHVGAPRVSTVRLAHSLVALGFLAHDANGRLTPGPAATGVARAYLQSLPIVALAQPVLDALARRCAASAQLLAHDGESVVVIAQALPETGEQPYRTTRIGARFELAQSGSVHMLTDTDVSGPALHADIVACAIAPADGMPQRFSVGLTGPLDADACRALVDTAARIRNEAGR
jgi:hypothetical protein